MIDAAPKAAAERLKEAATPRLVGLVADTARAYVERRAAFAIVFDAPRGGSMRVRDWLETVAAIDGCSPVEARALCDTLLRQLSLPLATTPLVSSLPATHLTAVALAEGAIAAWAQRLPLVVVPAPPLPWPARNDLRKLATELFAGVEVVLHAREAWELAHLVPIKDELSGFKSRGEPDRKKKGK